MLNWTSKFCAGLILAALPVAGIAQEAVESSPAPEKKTPKVVVCVAIDQFRQDYLDRLIDHMGEDGFRRFYEHGSRSPKASFEYAITVTSAGHATLMTGVNPAIHGIVENGFYVYEERAIRYSVEDTEHVMVNERGKYTHRGGTPKRLLVDTVGDELEKATDGAAKTLSVAGKDRSSILMAGHHPDEVYWFDSGQGRFVSSQYYMDQTPHWLNDFIAKGGIEAWVGKQWDLLKPEEFYPQIGTADDQLGESSWGLTNTMPKPLPDQADVNYYNQWAVTPFADWYTMEVAKEGMRALEIGQDDVPDLVTVSLSAFDKAGHSWGPDSWEMLDFALRTDETIAGMFDFLDEYVGEGEYVMLISADHGVAPLPEVAHDHGLDSGRIDSGKLFDGMREFLKQRFPETTCANYIVNLPWVYVQPPCEGTNKEFFLSEMKRWLEQQEGIGAVFLREELMGEPGEPGSILHASQQSFHPDRSGHLFILLDKYYLFMPGTGTGHFTPYDYDQDVPMLAYGMEFSGDEPKLMPEATSPNWMAKLARRALNLPEPTYEEPAPNPVIDGDEDQSLFDGNDG